jgi:zinc D-Ala-D-Ala carboxypeptidase
MTDEPPPPPSSPAPGRPDLPTGATPSGHGPICAAPRGAPTGTDPRPAVGLPGTRRRARSRRLARPHVLLALVATLAGAVAAVLLLTDDTPAAPLVGVRVDGSATEVPSVTGLDPELERRFEQARALAAEDGIELTLVSGWRSAEEQAQIVEDMVRKHGSLEEARRWVLPPEASGHVAGTAIDVGPTDGALWLEEHGAALGLCRTYANEMWHFEAVIEPGGTCPPMHEDSRRGWAPEG